MASVRSLLLFLGFSYILLSCVAVPATRSLHLFEEHSPSSAQSSLAQESVGKDSGGANIEGRMDVETTVDYPGTGANNHHDPKTPGRA